MAPRSRTADGDKRVPDYSAGGAGGSGMLLSRAAAMAACAAAFFTVVVIYAGEALVPVLSVLCVDGMLMLLWLAAAGLLGSVFAGPGARDTLGGPVSSSPATSLRLITSIAIGLGIFSLVTLGLGLAGWLNRSTAILMLIVSGAIGLANIALRLGNLKLEPYAEAAEAWLRRPARGAWLWVLAMPFLAMAAVSATLPPGLLWPDDPHPYDVLEYHLQIPREWYERGRIVPLKHNAFSYFPFNVEMNYLLAMELRGGPWAGMYLAQLMSLGYMALAVGGIYAGRRRWEKSGEAKVARASRPWRTRRARHTGETPMPRQSWRMPDHRSFRLLDYRQPGRMWREWRRPACRG